MSQREESRLTYKEIAEQLRDLAEDRKSFFHPDGDDEIFRRDHLACRQAARIFEAMAERAATSKEDIRPGDMVICVDSGVTGTALHVYKPTASAVQLMVRTADGRQYHAPLSSWRRKDKAKAVKSWVPARPDPRVREPHRKIDSINIEVVGDFSGPIPGEVMRDIEAVLRQQLQQGLGGTK